MITFEDLYEVYKICRKNNRKSIDQVNFEMNKYSRLMRLLDQVNKLSYHSDYTYSFIHFRQKPREIFAAEIEFKILQVYADIRLRPIIESQLTDRTFNNRKGKGTSGAIKLVITDIKEVSENYTNDNCWIIKIDLKGYFPNLDQEIAYKKVCEILDLYKGKDKPELIYICKYTCFFNPQFKSEKRSSEQCWKYIAPYKSLFQKEFGTGGVIGFLWWQVMANLFLNEFDKYCINNVEKHYIRFVDDIVIITTNKNKVLNSIPVLRQILKDIKVLMHPLKFYCQRYYNGVEFLGFHIKKLRIHLNRKTKYKAYKTLRDNCGLVKFVYKMNSYIGFMKMSTDIKDICLYMNRITRHINKDYINKKVSYA